MTSCLLNGEVAVANSASAAQLKRYQSKKRRSVYSRPTKPSHLSDRAAREAQDRLNNQLFMTGRSITPPPDSTNWASRNHVLLTVDDTNENKRFGRPSRVNNTVTQAELATTSKIVSVATSYGGTPQRKWVMKHTLSSGLFDEEVVERYQQIMASTAVGSNNVQLKKYNSKDEYNSAQEVRAANRTRAEKPATMEKVAADPNIGAIVKQTTMADLTAKYAKYSNAA